MISSNVRTGTSRPPIAIALALFFGVAFVGTGLALGDVYFAAFIAAIVFAIPLLLLPVESILWGGWVLTFVVAGQLQYFAHIGKAFWLPYLFGALLFMRLPIDLMARRNFSEPAVTAKNPLKMWIFVFFATALFSTAVNAPPLFQVLLALKEYLFLWGLLAVLGMGLVTPSFFAATWRAMLWLVPLHIPVVLYQRFVVAAGRADAAGFDAVVGLFGGFAETGGATGGMGLFLLFALALAISLWRVGRLPFLAVALIGATFLALVLLAEVKFVILLLPVVIGLLYRRDLLRRPFRTAGMMIAALVFAVGLSAFYQWQFANRGNANQGPFGYIERAIEKNSDDEFYNPATGEIGRVASLKYWWRQHDMGDPVTFLTGHGIGASRYGSVMGEQALKNRFFRIDRSTAAVYLWEIGLLGFAAFVGFLLAGARVAARLSRNASLGVSERAVLAAIAPVLLLQLAVLPYDTQLSALPQMQFMLMLMIGQVMFSARRAAANAATEVSASPTQGLGAGLPANFSRT